MEVTPQHEGQRTELLNRAPVSRPISNRYRKLLEFPVSYTKQRVALISNRYRMHVFVPDAFEQIHRNAPLVVPVIMRGHWRPSARAATIRMPMKMKSHMK